MKLATTTLAALIAVCIAGCGDTPRSESSVAPAETAPTEGDADASQPAGEAVRTAITEAISATALPVQVQALRPTVREGWHEVHYLDEAGRDQLAYASNDGETLFLGEMIDMRAGVSVSLLSALDVRAQLLRAEVGGGRTINWPAQTETQTVYAFTDPTCAACADLHAAIPELTAAGVTVYYLAFPPEGRGSKSFEATAAAWCRPNRAQGYDEAMKGGLTGSNEECVATVEHHRRLGQRMGVASAPVLISGAGMHIDGFRDAATLLAQLAPPAAAEAGGER